MDFATLCAQRYSLRKYSSRAVEQEKINLILQAARLTPTAHNQQPQRIFVLQSRDALEKADACTPCHFNAPLMMIIAYDPNDSWHREYDGKDHGEIDASLAVAQMMLQAADLGLGTCYIGMFDPVKLHASFPVLNGLVPVALLPIGYAAEDARPAAKHTVRKELAEIISYL